MNTKKLLPLGLATMMGSTPLFANQDTKTTTSVRIEHEIQDDKHQTVMGIGKGNEFTEDFRAYLQENKGKQSIQAGWVSPEIGNKTTTASLIIEGESDPLGKGLAAELVAKYKSIQINPTLEMRTNKEADDQYRAGIGISKWITDKTRLGFGYDKTNAKELFLVNMLYRADEQNDFGIAIQQENNENNTKIIAYSLRYDTDGIGWRIVPQYNTETGELIFHSIFAENSTMGRATSFFIERNREIAGVLSENIIAPSVKRWEYTPIIERTNGGGGSIH